MLLVLTDSINCCSTFATTCKVTERCVFASVYTDVFMSTTNGAKTTVYSLKPVMNQYFSHAATLNSDDYVFNCGVFI